MDSSFEANFNLRNKEGDYNLLAELIADKNNIPFSFVKICFLQDPFGKSCKVKMDKLACPKGTKLQGSPARKVPV